uniref:Uncharacterized protein LOC104243659 isoform X5 n=1 Tax=Nicotiana sylvestris TaxID=4096 RepID=A0A1U7Y5E8_NICSY|nr:PREDICTED: uncharacterized protein LOC104243659 isoform X5 [Nicotiana sylvestris]
MVALRFNMMTSQKKFSIPKRGEAWVLKSLGKKWKDYKCNLKGEYVKKHKTKDALLKYRPSRIPRDQWRGLVSYWLSDKAKIPDANSGHERVQQTSRMLSVAENDQHSHGTTHICPSSLLFEFSSFDFY